MLLAHIRLNVKLPSKHAKKDISCLYPFLCERDVPGSLSDPRITKRSILQK